MTLMVLKGISPLGTLFVARARHSFGGIDCKKCSIAGKSSTGSSSSLSRSDGMFRASFQIHFSTSSAILASLASGSVALLGKGFTICRRRVNSDLKRSQYKDVELKGKESLYRTTVIRRHVANNLRMIMLINRDRSLTLLLGLSSV